MRLKRISPTVVVHMPLESLDMSVFVIVGKDQCLRGTPLCHTGKTYIPVSVSDLYIFLIGLPILLQANRWAERGNI